MSKLKYYLFNFVIILISYNLSYAKPIIQPYNNQIAHNDTITVTGSNFGTKSQGAPFAWSNMESNSLAAEGTNWTSYGWPSGIMKVTSNNKRNGFSEYSATCDVPGNGNEYCAFRQEGATSNVWFIQYWVYVGSDWSWEDGNIKILRLWNSSSSNLRVQGPINNVDVVVETSDMSHGGYSSNCSSGGWTPVTSSFNTANEALGHGCSGEILPGSVGWSNYRNDIKDGEWHLFQWEYKSGSGASGVLRWWVDGKLIFDHSDINTGNNAKQPFIVGWYMSNSSDGNGNLYFDDVYIDKTWARIEIGNKADYNSCTKREIQIPISWNSNSIKFKINQGAFQKGEPAYLFVIDQNGTPSVGSPVSFGEGGATTPPPTPIDNPPSVNITTPTTADSFVTGSDTLLISGNSDDDFGITTITWANNRGGNGTALNTAGDWSSFSIGNIGLLEGANLITVTATDNEGQKTTDSISVSYTSSGTNIAWSAVEQTGDYSWTDSSVTYSVRLLIEGSEVSQSGNQVMLGFQGRNSGPYTIKKVSIAERNTSGSVGDVVNSTWTQVTFDGNDVANWDNDLVTVSAGTEKLSDPIEFNIQAGKDYYVTFKIESPSVYLDPPSYYSELYFDSEDHASDVDWTSNGYSTTVDYHALSKIYVLGGDGGPDDGTSPPSTPPGLRINMN